MEGMSEKFHNFSSQCGCLPSTARAPGGKEALRKIRRMKECRIMKGHECGFGVGKLGFDLDFSFPPRQVWASHLPPLVPVST